MRTLLALAVVSVPAAAQTPARDVYLLAGQSNMAGRGVVAPEDLRIHPRVFALDADEAWQPAVDPLHFDKEIAGVGPGLAFGRLLAEQGRGAEIGLVPCAVGGTSITRWRPGAEDPRTRAKPFDDLVRRLAVAQRWGIVRGVIWHQGESDLERDPDTYRDELVALIGRVRAAAGDPGLPWLVGTLGDFKTEADPRARAMNALLASLPHDVDHLACVSARGLRDKGDGTHFDAASARELGRRYALAMLDLQRGLAPAPGKPSSRPLWPGTPPVAARVAFEPGEPGPGGRLGRIRTPDLTVHLPPVERRTGAAVLVCPGGGYSIVAAGHEGTAVAEWLGSLGIVAAVLRYRLLEYGHPAPMLDAQRAMRWLRSRAGLLGVDADRIGIIGFSAGGHLASTVATHFDDGDQDARDLVDRTGCRPDFAVLVYPVITMDGPAAHRGSRRNLLGPEPSAAWRRYYSNETQVTARTPPTFLVHSRDDRVVPLANSELFRDALQRANVPCELLVFEQGGHGFGLGRDGADCAAWPERCAAWLRER